MYVEKRSIFAPNNTCLSMKISYKDKKLEALCRDKNKLIKAYGQLRAEIMMKRLSVLYAAESLEDVRFFPGHYHELTGDRKGQWACDLDQPYRLIFEPTNKPIPIDSSGKYIWKEIRIIDIVEIANYHGK